MKATKQSSSHQNDTNRRTRRNHNGQKCTEERTTGPEWGAGVGIESRACEREILGTRTTPPKQLAEHSYPNLVPALLRNCARLLWPVHHPTMNTTRILTLISDLLGSDDFFESSSWRSVTLLFRHWLYNIKLLPWRFLLRNATSNIIASTTSNITCSTTSTSRNSEQGLVSPV